MQKLDNNSRELKAFNLVKEAKIANFAKLANMLIDLFGIPEAFQKYVKPKREGHLVEMEFPALENSLLVALTRDKNNYHASWGKATNPVATIVINVDREKAAVLVGNIIRQKSNIFGLLYLVPKILTRKIKIKGSLFAALAFARTMMLGKHTVYTNL